MIDCLAALQASDATSRYTANQPDKETVLSFSILSGRPEFGQKEFGNANRFRSQSRQVSNKVLIHYRRDVKVCSFCRVYRLFSYERNIGLPFLTKEILKSVFHYFVLELPLRLPLKVSPFFSTEFLGTTHRILLSVNTLVGRLPVTGGLCFTRTRTPHLQHKNEISHFSDTNFSEIRPRENWVTHLMKIPIFSPACI